MYVGQGQQFLNNLANVGKSDIVINATLANTGKSGL